MNRTIRMFALLMGYALLAACGSTSSEAPAPETAAPTSNPAEALVLAGQVDPTDLISRDSSVRKGTLDNGLTWYVRPNQKPEKRATLFMVVGAGSVDEEIDKERGVIVEEWRSGLGARDRISDAQMPVNGSTGPTPWRRSTTGVRVWSSTRAPPC